MKKSTKILAAFAALVLIAGLIIINRNRGKKQEELARAKQLTCVILGEEKIYSYSEDSSEYTAFDTQMKRKNGDVFDKNYSGIELRSILSEMGVRISDNTVVTATCRDNYRIDITAEELLCEGNIYLVTRESGEELGEESGTFMLVINNDEFSTRWGKNIVSIEVK